MDSPAFQPSNSPTPDETLLNAAMGAKTGASYAPRPRLVVATAKPIDVAIIGAGPYGLSIAAHLRACNIPFRIFGRPMETWSAHMPGGMLLKSEGFASCLSDPHEQLTLKAFCKERDLPYADLGLPVPLETMVAYGTAFQQRLVPELEPVFVQRLDQIQRGFKIVLSSGEHLTARHVIVAVGYSHFQYVPETLAGLPSEFLSHSSRQHDLRHLGGRHVTIIGRGASAIDLAALLHESGAEVQMMVRAANVIFGSLPRPRTPWDRIRSPLTQLGSGWKSVAYCEVPALFRYLPRDARLSLIKNTLGPAGGWAMRDRVVGRVPMLLAHTPDNADVRSGRVHLRAFTASGVEKEVVTDHVIAATGYRVDVRRLSFLGPDISTQLKCDSYVPVLSRDFESSIRGMYFVGLAATNYFGPVMRFVAGAHYTAKKMATHLSARTARG